MKRLILAMGFILAGASAYAVVPGKPLVMGNAGQIYESYDGRLYFVDSSTGPILLSAIANGGVANIIAGNGLLSVLSGPTITLSVDTTTVISNQSTLQTGAVFDVSSGTVAGPLSIGDAAHLDQRIYYFGSAGTFYSGMLPGDDELFFNGEGFLVNGGSASRLVLGNVYDAGIQRSGANVIKSIDGAGGRGDFQAREIFVSGATASRASFNVAQGTAPTSPIEGDMWNDGVQKTLMRDVNGSVVSSVFVSTINTTAVTNNVNDTADHNLMAVALSPGTLNATAKAMRINVYGTYNNVIATTPTITFKTKLCTVSGCGSGTVVVLSTWTTTATSATASTNIPWSINNMVITTTAGSSAAFESHGVLSIDLSNLLTTPDTIFSDSNSAATSPVIDSTGNLFLQVTGTWSSASATNSLTERVLTVEILN